MADYSQNVYKDVDTGKYYSLVNGTARYFTDQENAAKLNPNAQNLRYGVNTSGYTERFGGGTTGGAWDTGSFTSMLNAQQINQQANQAAEQAAAKSNAQVTSSVPVAPTDFQKYFQGELAKGRAAGDILSNNPFMAGGAQGPALQAPAAPQAPATSSAPSPATTYAGNSIVDYLKSAGKATDFTSRAQMAAEQGIANYKGTAEQNLQLLNKLRAAQPKPPAPSGIAADKAFEKPGTVDLSKTGATGTAGSTGDATVDTSKQMSSSIAENLKLLEGEKTTAQIDAEKMNSRAMQLLAESLGRTKMLSEEEKKAGIDEYKTNLKNLQNELATKTAAYEKLYADIAGKPITMNSIIGADAQARRVAQADLGFLNAQALAMQNNIDFAKQTAKDAVDAKYGPIDEEINILAKQLELIQPTLTKEEKLRADAVKLALDQRKEALDAVKEKENTLTDFNINMIAKYPSAGIRTTDDYAVTQQKILGSAEYKAEMAAATKKSSSGSGIGTWTPSTPVPTMPVAPKQTFEEFIAQEENKAGQSFSQAKRDELRKTYDAAQVTPTPAAQSADLSNYDYPVQLVITGKASPDSLLSGGTAGERKRYSAQLEDAQKRGLLKPVASDKQKSVFNSIVSAYNKSPLIMASDRTSILQSAISNVKNNPENGTAQLNLVYGYIQALDSYQSAVREGELGLVNSIDSSVGKWKNTFEKIQNGQIVRGDVAKQIADAAQMLVTTINQASKNKEKSFASQAKVNGVEDLWTDFRAGSASAINNSIPLSTGSTGQTSSGLKYTIIK